MREREGSIWPPSDIYASITDVVYSAAPRAVWIFSVDCVRPDYGLEFEGEVGKGVEGLCCHVGEVRRIAGALLKLEMGW